MANAPLRYTACNEDGRSELRALKITPSDRVLAIGGSGGRVLDLLIDKPAEIVALDQNPAQLALLALKIACLQALPYDELLWFLGVRAQEANNAALNRLRLFDTRIAPLLSPVAQRFWQRQRWRIARGFLFTGHQERFFAHLFAPLQWLWGKRLRTLFSFDNLEDQRHYYNSIWRTRTFALAVRMGCSRLLFRTLLRDPSFFRFVPPDTQTGVYMLERIDHAFCNLLARDNHFLQLLAFGRYTDERALPLHLRREHCDTIRAGVSRIRLRLGLLDHTLTYFGPFDAWSLSDVSGWCTTAAFSAIIAHVLAASAPGARICYRNFLVKRSWPTEHRTAVELDAELTADLAATDGAFAYSFVVGTVGRLSNHDADGMTMACSS